MRTVLTAGLTTALVAAGVVAAPATHASHESVDCRLVAVAETTLTGHARTFTGIAAGYVVGGVGEAVSIRCGVYVDGTLVFPIPGPSSGTTAAVFAGQVTYDAEPTQTVELCAEWTAGSESGTTCFPVQRETVSPNDVVDEATAPIVDAVGALLDPVVCLATNTVDDVQDVRGAIDIEDDGDVTVLGVPVWDCPPKDQPDTDVPVGPVTVMFA